MRNVEVVTFEDGFFNGIHQEAQNTVLQFFNNKGNAIVTAIVKTHVKDKQVANIVYWDRDGFADFYSMHNLDEISIYVKGFETQMWSDPITHVMHPSKVTVHNKKLPVGKFVTGDRVDIKSIGNTKTFTIEGNTSNTEIIHTDKVIIAEHTVVVSKKGRFNNKFMKPRYGKQKAYSEIKKIVFIGSGN